MDWKGLLAYITGDIDEELRLRNEYLAAENRILGIRSNCRNPSDMFSPSNQSVSQSSSFSAKHLCGIQFDNTSSIITENAGIKEKATASSFHRRRRKTAPGLSVAGNDWAACCASTIAPLRRKNFQL
ncbi:hypothetical protein ACFLU6_08990 [Acidobacteriota bacterium]